MTLFLDLDVRVGLERAAHGKGRNLQENRYEGFDVSFHEKLHEGYKIMAKEEPNRFVTIDASQDVDGVQKQIRDAVKARFLS
jgi:dTMP kinase